MKTTITALLVCINILLHAQVKPSIHTYTALTIDGNTISLGKYAGKKIMLVNTASYCSYTPQFADLEQLYKAYKQYGFEIVGFPCNDFGAQDPGKDSAISLFCLNNYGVSFQMMSKIKITNGDTAHVYRWLQRFNLNGVKNTQVDWNFNKYLINESGNLVTHYTSSVSPLDAKIKNWILSPTSLTGVSDQEENEFAVRMISSNPVHSVIELINNNDVTAEHISLTLYSIDGKEILNTFFTGTQRGEKLNVDVSSVNNGLYILNLHNGNKQSNFRVIVLH